MKSLDKIFHYSIDQQFNQIARGTVPFYAWLGLGFLLICMTGMIGWIFLGTIDTKVKGQGIVLRAEGLFTIQSQVGGVVEAIRMKPGDRVNKSDVVAEVVDRDSNSLEDVLDVVEIYSPFDGTVLEIFTDRGQVIEEGGDILSLELHTSSVPSYLFYCYFPLEIGKHIVPGDFMTMNLSFVNEQEYGKILGQVRSVSAHAVSEKSLLNQIKNINLIYFLTQGQPVIEVVAVPLVDSKDPSGYRWTSGLGPEMQLSTGLVGTAEVTVEQVRPLHYFFSVELFK